MSGTSQSQSASGNGSVNVEPQDPKSNPNHKREACSETNDLTAKKSRTEASTVSDGAGCEEEGNPAAVSGQENAKELTFEIEADAAEDKGSRHTMEDAWIVLLDASLDHPGKLSAWFSHVHTLQSMMDMGAGWLQNMRKSICMKMFFQQDYHLDVKVAKRAILEGFRKTDESLLQESAARGWQDGATAACVWVLGQKVFVANIGDAKAVLARSAITDGCQNNSDGHQALKAIVLTREHKAIYPQERARIQKAGGVVSSNGRLQGRLEVSRAFGDRQFKKVFGPSDAVDFVQKLLTEGLPVPTVARLLVREAVRERCCKDNCTAIVIVFKRK